MVYQAVETLRREGYLKLTALSGKQVDETLDYLTSREVFLGRHVTQGASGFAPYHDSTGANVIAWRMRDAVLAPHLFETALCYRDFAAAYLEVGTPFLYSMNVFATRPSSLIRPDIQEWHRDADDKRFLPMFFFLTDVGSDGRQELRVDGREVPIDGPAGTVFFSDTMREHRGLKPKYRERIVAWARWGISDPPESYKWDALAPIDKALLGDRYPEDPKLRASIKLIAA